MKKSIIFFVLAVIIFSFYSFDVTAQTIDSTDSISEEDISCEDAENSDVGNTENDMYSVNNPQPQRINRMGSCYCYGGGLWGHITGDNNAIGEGVFVTNLTSKIIEVKGYTENGTLRGSCTIYPGERGWFGFWIWDGTYYFKVRFQDLSAGDIAIYMKSDWYLD